MERANADASCYQQNNQDSIGGRESDQRYEDSGYGRAEHGEESARVTIGDETIDRLHQRRRDRIQRREPEHLSRSEPELDLNQRKQRVDDAGVGIVDEVSGAQSREGEFVSSAHWCIDAEEC